MAGAIGYQASPGDYTNGERDRSWDGHVPDPRTGPPGDEFGRGENRGRGQDAVDESVGYPIGVADFEFDTDCSALELAEGRPELRGCRRE